MRLLFDDYLSSDYLWIIRIIDYLRLFLFGLFEIICCGLFVDYLYIFCCGLFVDHLKRGLFEIICFGIFEIICFGFFVVFC